MNMHVAAARTQLRARDALPHFDSIEDLIATMDPAMPVYAVHPKRLAAQAERYLTGFPGETLYAVKANPTEPVLDALWAAGIRHFDTASLGEVALVKGRFPQATCHFMTPLRIRGQAGEAYRRFGVRTFVVDEPTEIERLARETGAIEDLTILVRVIVPAEGALLELNSKFGCGPDDAVALLREIARRGAKTGLTFHVGSQCLAPSAYITALRFVGAIIARADVDFSVLDVGGGFPAPYANLTVPPLDAFFAAIREGLAKLALPKDVTLYCEPGRGLVANGVSVVAQVIQRKGDRLYLNDGVYGSFDEMTLTGWDGDYPARAVRRAGPRIVPVEGPMEAFTAYGPTCDTLDRLPRPLALPETVRPNDFVVFELMGAYTAAVRTHFNGFHNNSFALVD